jgi:hypothetical protein
MGSGAARARGLEQDADANASLIRCCTGLNPLPTFARLIMHKSAFPGLLAWLAAIAVHAGVVWLVAPPL